MKRRFWLPEMEKDVKAFVSVFVVRHSINVLKVFSTPSLFLVVLGHTFQW